MTLTGGMFAMDDVVISRTTTTTDAEGNATDSLTPVFTGRGTWGLPSYRDVIIADSRGQNVAASLVIPNGVQVFLDDRVDVRGSRYEVIGRADARINQRLTLRQISS